MMLRSRTYYEGLVAKSLYEPLTAPEERRLARALERDPALRATRDELTKVTSEIPAESSLNTPDLLPDLRIAIASETPDRAWRWSAWLPRKRTVVWAAAFGVPVLIALTQLVPMLRPLDEPPIELAASETLMQQAIGQAELLIAERNPSEAIVFLETALRAQPNDPEAGRAQLLLADAAYEDDRFGTSLDAYFALQRQHPDYLNARDEAVRSRVAERIALLDECRTDDFETLHAYLAALDVTNDRFERLEEVAARAAADPHGLLAARIVRSMAESLDGSGELADADARVAALEKVRDRCSNPIVAARASFEAGRAYEEEVGDAARAADAYRIAGRHSAYEEAAATALARLTPQ